MHILGANASDSGRVWSRESKVKRKHAQGKSFYDLKIGKLIILVDS